MDNNNFEQQFSQNVKSTVPAQSVTLREEPSKLPLIIAVVLAAITLIESIILVITLVNYFQEMAPVEDDIISEGDYGIIDDGLSGYSNDGDLIWLNLTCTNEDSGDKIVLTESKTIQQYKNSSIVGNNTYSIVNDSLISLSGDENKVLFYDGYSIADGLKIYDCDFNVEESTNTEE